METEAILIVHEKFSGAEVMPELASIYPEELERARFVGARLEGARFECRRPWGDDLITRLMDCLAAHGLKPRGRTQHSPNNYQLVINRTYSRSDLMATPYLTFMAKKLALGERSSDGVLDLKSEELRSGVDIASTYSPWTIVSDRVKQSIAGAAINRVAFRETRLRASEGKLTRRRQDGFWELTSDLVLPPMGHPCKFVDALTKEEVPCDSNAPFIFREGLEVPEYLYLPPEPHYDEAALQETGQFDLALTF